MPFLEMVSRNSVNQKDLDCLHVRAVDIDELKSKRLLRSQLFCTGANLPTLDYKGFIN